MQYTTVPYVPPFLNGNRWQAECVCGSDLEGFTLQLRDTQAGSTAAPRFIYVRHGGSLINTSAHQYVEITPVVNSYLGSVEHTAGSVPKIVRVGLYFFIALGDWQQGALRIGGWNALDASFPFTQNALPASPATYNPQSFTITTSGLPGGDYTQAQQFPSIMGNNSPGGSSIWRLYNYQTGSVTTPAFYNAPDPINAGWTTNISAFLEGEKDAGENVYIAVGSVVAPGNSNGEAISPFVVYTARVFFLSGTTGNYSACQLVFTTTSTTGTDLYHMQPGNPLYGGFNVGTNNVRPAENVQSNVQSPTTCVDKLPVAGFYMGQGVWGGVSPQISWYYSGATAISAYGNSFIARGVTKPVGAQGGSLAAARANKLANLYPMFNVNLRADFNVLNGAAITGSFIQPSGQMILNYNAHMIGPDLVLSAAVLTSRAQGWVVSQLPANSDITNQSYNRFGTAVPGFGTRVAEYQANLPNPVGTLSIWGCVWPTGMANAKAPINFNFPALTSAGIADTWINGAGVRLGTWTLSGGVYQPPPVVWNYASNMADQVRAVFNTASSVARASYPNLDTMFFVDLVPLLNRSGNGLAGFAIGVLYARTTSNNRLTAVFIQTPCTLSGTTISLSQPSSVSILGTAIVDTAGVPGTALGNDLNYGQLHIVYPSSPTGDFYIAWRNPMAIRVAGDAIQSLAFMRFNSGNSFVQGGFTVRSQSRAYLSCSVQHQGLAVMPYRDSSTFPEIDIPISRYATSATNTQDDLIASFQAAINNPMNLLPSSINSYNIAEILVLNSINNNFLLQIGSMAGRLNHKQFNLPSTFIDMTNQPVGTYYLYLTDTGTTIELQVDSAQRPESITSMYFGKFDRTATGFANQESVSEVIRFGTARLVAGSENKPMQGSQIRIGPYVG